MLDKFWDALGEEMAKRWLDYLFGPAFLFWFAGLGLYTWHYGWNGKYGWDAVESAWNGWAIYQQIATLLIAILVVFLSSKAMQTFQFPAIRLLEGYWPWPLNKLGSHMVSRNRKDFARRYKILLELKIKDDNKSTSSDEQNQLRQLDAWIHSNPAQESYLLPTRLGNLIRAREQASSRKYGLDSIVCWPRFWCLLPECLQNEITSSRAALNQNAELWLWGLLFLVWMAMFLQRNTNDTILEQAAPAIVVVLISIVWMFFAYRMALQNAAIYGDLVETAFDLHRFALYDAVSWPRPIDSDEEKAKGEQLSEFLWRGTVGGKVEYVIPFQEDR